MSENNQPATVRIGTWNTKCDNRREKPGNRREVRIAASLADPGCDVLCITEGSAGLLPGDGHMIDAGTDWGIPPQREDHRKVLLWSGSPWTEVDCVGSLAFPAGRFVKGITQTPIGPLTVVGVCIPYERARASRGRASWQDHEAWLQAFEMLPWRHATDRMIVLGDFNQRIPRIRVRKRTYQALLQAFEGLEITTAGEIPGAPGLAIDHIAHTPDLKRATNIGIWAKRTSDDRFLSDHFGVWADFSLATTT